MPNQVFLDTNILVYSRDEASPFFDKVIKTIEGLVVNKATLCIHKQVLREYACVATRAAPNGLGATTERALREIEEFEAAYLVLPDYEGIWPIWKQLVKSNGVKGLRIHDAYIAAVMIGYNIPSILTLNTEDFQCFQEIKPITPDTWYEIL
jgi:predicted nucleic acid-binding protein